MLKDCRFGWARISTALISGCLLIACTTTNPPIEPTKPTASRPKLGLALGGGAARGFAHVGVIAALEEAGIEPDLVVGTSAGSLVAALYASGYNANQLQSLSQSMEEATLTDWTLPLFNRGVLRGEALARYVNDRVRQRTIEQFPRRLGIVATQLQTGEGVLLQRGNTGQAVRASSSVPAVFEPTPLAGKDYVDGGLVAPVPVRYAKQMGADVVIAVDISSQPQDNSVRGTLAVLLQTFSIMGKSINRFELQEADIVIRPALGGYSGTDFGNRQQAIELGKAAMRAQIPALKARLERHNK